ncbi:MAG TPA: hypothetical protein VNA12_03045 [Mycobacteriales bacterium]|nr:hypothetical protein [Mycobacteriales bacterium]
MRLRAALAAASSVLLIAPVSALAGPAPTPYSADPVAEGIGKDLVPVAHIAYKGGTDLEFTTIKGRDYAIAPSENAHGGTGALHIIDITNPERIREVGTLPCNVTQNDVQVRGTLVLMGVDGGAKDDVCYQQARVEKPSKGMFVIDIKNPRKPRAIGFVPIATGVHNQTWHPGGRYVYISDSELTPDNTQPVDAKTGRIQIVDLANPRKPVQVGQLGLPTGLSSHDITFDGKGDRAFSAALTQTVILDTSSPAEPVIEHVIIDPSINISHGADPTPDGKYLLVTDEQAGAAANGVCNVGGVHVYDVSLPVPVKVGFYGFNPANSATATTNSGELTCTAHVLDYAPDGKSFSNAGYAAGVRIVDTKSVIGVPKELAYFTPVDASTWSAKTYKSQKYLFANDLNRGFDVYRYSPGQGVVDTRSAKTRSRLSFRTPGAGTVARGEYCFTEAASGPDVAA